MTTNWSACSAAGTASRPGRPPPSSASSAALIRRRPHPGTSTRPGGLPTAWHRELASEIALELAISMRAADALISVAWDPQARLPRTAAALDAGVLSFIKG